MIPIPRAQAVPSAAELRQLFGNQVSSGRKEGRPEPGRRHSTAGRRGHPGGSAFK
jgi:hypothetical protein